MKCRETSDLLSSKLKVAGSNPAGVANQTGQSRAACFSAAIFGGFFHFPSPPGASLPRRSEIFRRANSLYNP